MGYSDGARAGRAHTCLSDSVLRELSVGSWKSILAGAPTPQKSADAALRAASSGPRGQLANHLPARPWASPPSQGSPWWELRPCLSSEATRVTKVLAAVLAAEEGG